MKFGFTEHAIDRYMQFYTDPREQSSRNVVRLLLAKASETAVKIKDKTPAGDTQWRIEELGCVLVTKPDDRQHVVVTILPPHVFAGPEAVDYSHWEEFHQETQRRIKELLAEKPEVTKELRKAQSGIDLPLIAEAASRGKAPRALRREKIDAATHKSMELKAKISIAVQEVELYRMLLKETAQVRQKQASTGSANTLRKALKVCIRHLTDAAKNSPEAAQALAQVQEINPGWLSESFYKAP